MKDTFVERFGPSATRWPWGNGDQWRSEQKRAARRLKRAARGLNMSLRAYAKDAGRDVRHPFHGEACWWLSGKGLR